MTPAQWVFWVTAFGLSSALTPVLYPGVKRHAASRRDSLLATWMAATLFSTSVALVAAFLVHLASAAD